MGASRQWYRPTQKWQARRSQSFKACFWCGEKYDQKSEFMRRSREHLIPRSLGGPCDITNVVFAHVKCNNERSSSTDWVPYMEHRKLGRCVRQEAVTS